MLTVQLDHPGLSVEIPIKKLIATHIPQWTDSPEEIPLSLCFKRRGFGYRSAIALKLVSCTDQLPTAIANTFLDYLSKEATTQPATSALKCTVTTTNQGWIEFFLTEDSLGEWLDRLLQRLQPDAFRFSPTNADQTVLFRWQYIHARCSSLLSLAAHHFPDAIPQWHFTEALSSPWEQAMLDQVVRFGLAVEKNKLRRSCLEPIEMTFWIFYQQASLFGQLQRHPLLGVHYLRWLSLIKAIFQFGIEQSFHVEAITSM